MKNNLGLKCIVWIFSIVLVWGLNACEDIVPADVNLSIESTQGYESTGTVTITAQLSKTVSRNVSVDLEVGGSAVRGDHYEITPPLRIEEGDTRAVIDLRIVDNFDFDPVDKEVIVFISEVSSSATTEIAKIGGDSRVSFTIQEDDLEIELEWNADVFLDLKITRDASNYRIDFDQVNPKVLHLTSNDNDDEYAVVVEMAPGRGAPDEQVDYTVTLSFPDGSTQEFEGFFDADNFNDLHTVTTVTKTGVNYTIM